MKKIRVLSAFCLISLALAGCSTTYYSVKFVLDDGTVLEVKEVKNGDKATYSGETPTKEAEEGKVYTFEGWTYNDTLYQSEDLPVIIEDTEFVATFKEGIASFSVTWIVGDEKTTETYNYGETPTFKGETTKDSTEQFDYTFTGWDKEITPVKEDVAYTALFKESLRDYEITWVVDGEETKEIYTYGETPTFKGETTKEADEQYTYTFKSWDKEITPVNGDARYEAIFEETLREYEITWVIGNESTIESYHYGDTPSFKGDTNRESSAEFDYTFKGWDKEIVPVTGDATYIALYDESKRSYEVNFYDEDGETLLFTGTYEYGETPVFDSTLPTKEGDNYIDYVFEGWKLDNELFTNDNLPEVIGEANFIASFKEVAKMFDVSVRYLSLDGEVLGEEVIGEASYDSTFNFEVKGLNNLEPNIDRAIGRIDGDKSLDVYLSEVDVYDGTSKSESLEGNGTEESPYLIQSVADLAYFKDLVGGDSDLTNVHFKLTKSIDLSKTTDFRIGVNGKFEGIFDGNNCVIKGINLDSTQTRNSLFYQTASSAKIMNLTTKGEIKGAQYCGGIVGQNEGEISNCKSFVNIEQNGGNGTGGICGGNKGKVLDCENYGNITCTNSSNNKTSGIIGAGEGGSYVENSINYGNVTGYRFVAGVVGENQSAASNIVSCMNFGNISGEGLEKNDRIDMGGIAGTVVDQDITDCINYGNVSGKGEDSKYIGGVVGTFKSGNFTGNYNYGTVINEALYTGGIAGCAVTGSMGNIDKCFNYGFVDSSQNGVGGILGGTIRNTCVVTITNCENHGDINGNNKVGGISGALTGGTADESNKNYGKITSVGTDFGDIIGSTK